MRKRLIKSLTAGLTALVAFPVSGLEIQGFTTRDCRRDTGLVVHVTEDTVEYVDLSGRSKALPIDDIATVYVYNVIDNPIDRFVIDETTLGHLRAVYVEDSNEPRALAFPVRFIEDLVIFFSIDGKSHVHTFDDLFKLRPAPRSALGTRRPSTHKPMAFDFPEHSAKCPAERPKGGVKPTRVLADRITIDDFFNSYQQGYEALASFQERTYLYARPLLFDQKTRMGLVFHSKRDEPGIAFPIYWQWSTGEPYRFQSFNVIGGRTHEFLPNAEPVFAVRSDVKSHVFHGLFIGNVAGIPAGNAVFLGTSSQFELKRQVAAEPSFNYLAMMGGDYGPYSLSVGFYYPTFGLRVRDEYREVRGTSPSYAVRAMLTTARIRIRAIGSLTKYSKGTATRDDVLARTGESGPTDAPQSYEFQSTFLRGGVDYDFTKRLSVSLDGIALTGNYKEVRNGLSSDMEFNRLTVQGSLRQSFSDYVSITGFVNLLQHSFESNFLNQDLDREQRETRFFGTFEFIF